MEKEIQSLILVGKTESHLEIADEEGRKMHREALGPFLAMQDEAREAGFALRLCSAFRGFDAQLGIWNAKATGKRPIHDRNGLPVNVSSAAPDEVLEAILRWSALPGASRHHWGTDIDVYDAYALDPGMELRLDPSEFEGRGRFAPLHDWIDANMKRFGFYRPYDVDRGGVSPERWHLSYAPVSDGLFRAHSADQVAWAISEAPLALKDVVLDRLPRLYERYALGISRP